METIACCWLVGVNLFNINVFLLVKIFLVHLPESLSKCLVPQNVSKLLHFAILCTELKNLSFSVLKF